MFPSSIQHDIKTGKIVPIVASDKAKKHIHDHFDANLITAQDLHEWEVWYASERHYAPANARWKHLLSSRCHITGIGYSVATINPRHESVEGIDLDDWWGKQLGVKPPKYQEPPPTSFEDFMKRWKNYTPEERRSYIGLFPDKFRKGSVEMAVAALEGNENPMDMDMKGIGDSPADLDLS